MLCVVVTTAQHHLWMRQEQSILSGCEAGEVRSSVSHRQDAHTCTLER